MLRKLTESKWFKKVCKSPEHDSPKYMDLKPGTYEHTCPKCGNKIIFTVASKEYN